MSTKISLENKSLVKYWMTDIFHNLIDQCLASADASVWNQKLKKLDLCLCAIMGLIQLPEWTPWKNKRKVEAETHTDGWREVWGCK